MLFLNENAHFWSTQRQARRQPKPVTQLSSPDPQPSSAPFAWSARGPQTRVPTLFGPSPAEGPAKLPSLFGAAHARSPKFLFKPNSPGPFHQLPSTRTIRPISAMRLARFQQAHLAFTSPAFPSPDSLETKEKCHFSTSQKSKIGQYSIFSPTSFIQKSI